MAARDRESGRRHCSLSGQRDAHPASTVRSELALLYPPRGHGFGPQEGWTELGVV